MTKQPQPHPRELSFALSLVDMRRWSSKGRLVELVRAETIDAAKDPTFVLLSWADAAAWLGVGVRTAGRDLGALVRDGVLLAQESAGTRAVAYAVSGAFDRWAEVPWRVPRSEALARIAVASFAGDLRAQDPASARIWPRALGPLARASGPRAQNGPARASGCARKASASARVWVRAQGTDDLVEGYSSLEERTLRGGDDDDERLRQLKAAVAAGTGGGRVWGGTEARLRAVAARANGNLEALCSLARSSGARSPVELVGLLEQADLVDLAVGAKRADPARVRLESRLAALRAAGDPDGEIPELEAELGNLGG